MSIEENVEADRWSTLPEHVVVNILSRLSMSEAFQASLTCRAWSTAFRQPPLWRTVAFAFCRGSSKDEKSTRALAEHGDHFRNVAIRIDQGDKENRRLGVQFLNKLGQTKQGRVRRLRLEFVGTNPLFYGGQEFVDALRNLFDKSIMEKDQSAKHDFEFIDLSRTPVMYTDELFSTLRQNHCSTLRYLNIQTKQFICKIQPQCMVDLVTACKRLIDLRVCHSSLSNPVLEAFAEKDRDSLRHLSILCRRQEKYFHHDLTEAMWSYLVEACPKLVVTLKFDPTCPLEKAREIMKPPIPVAHLFLEMYTNAHEIAVAVEFYHRTLTKLVVQAKSSPMLQTAILDAAAWCHRLRSLHVMCVLDFTVIEEILKRRPELEAPNCTLKYELEPHPWVSDEILDELPNYV